MDMKSSFVDKSLPQYSIFTNQVVETLFVEILLQRKIGMLYKPKVDTLLFWNHSNLLNLAATL